MDITESRRLAMLRYPLMIGVVFIHAYDTTIQVDGASIGILRSFVVLDFLRNFFSVGLASVAVPLFFLMSGYFLFMSKPFTLARYGNDLKKRLRTLLIPFLFWNLVVMAVFVIVQSIPATRSYLSGAHQDILGMSFYEIINNIFGLSHIPIAYQFWFIRDLIVLILLSPVFYVFHRYAAWPVLILLAVLWGFSINLVYIPRIDALAWFYAGTLMATRKISLFLVDRVRIYLCVMFGLFVVACALFPTNQVFLQLNILIGAFAVLSLTGVVLKQESFSEKLILLGDSSFFLFATHEPLLMTLRKLAYRNMNPNSEAMGIVLYFSLPIFTIAFCTIMHRFLKRFFPRLLAFSTGGRR